MVVAERRATRSRAGPLRWHRLLPRIARAGSQRGPEAGGDCNTDRSADRSRESGTLSIGADATGGRGNGEEWASEILATRIGQTCARALRSDERVGLGKFRFNTLDAVD